MKLEKIVAIFLAAILATNIIIGYMVVSEQKKQTEYQAIATKAIVTKAAEETKYEVTMSRLQDLQLQLWKLEGKGEE